MKVTIKKEILNILNDFNVLAYKMDVKVENSEIIEEEIKRYELKIKEEYSLEDVLNIPLIKEARDGYKKLGKDPSRYRLACESLLRRLVKGNELYRINNVVDVGNLVSIELKRSIAVLDYNKIVGNVNMRIGTVNDEYYGIGRGLINVENIIVYEDDISPFGSPTSDTERTMVTDDTKQILVFTICFGKSDLERDKTIVVDMFKKYAYANNIEEIKVIGE